MESVDNMYYTMYPLKRKDVEQYFSVTRPSYRRCVMNLSRNDSF